MFRIRRIRMFFGLPDPPPDTAVRVRIRESASGSVLKCHGSATLASRTLASRDVQEIEFLVDISLTKYLSFAPCYSQSLLLADFTGNHS